MAYTPEETIQLLNKLYDFDLNTQKINSYDLIIKEIKKISLADQNKIFDTYLRILDKTRADIPPELQDYWRQHQSRLGLTGKFLPKDSNLKEN